LRRIAQDLGLVITGSSDYHGTRKQGHDLGCNTTRADQYERLRAHWQAGASQRLAGGPVEGVVERPGQLDVSSVR
jgi:hypothetical protein